MPACGSARAALNNPVLTVCVYSLFSPETFRPQELMTVWSWHIATQLAFSDDTVFFSIAFPFKDSDLRVRM